MAQAANQAQWRKSSRSNGGGGAQCVELAFLADGGHVRDSKNPGKSLPVNIPALVAAVKAGKLNV